MIFIFFGLKAVNQMWFILCLCKDNDVLPNFGLFCLLVCCVIGHEQTVIRTFTKIQSLSVTSWVLVEEISLDQYLVNTGTIPSPKDNTGLLILHRVVCLIICGQTHWLSGYIGSILIKVHHYNPLGVSKALGECLTFSHQFHK